MASGDTPRACTEISIQQVRCCGGQAAVCFAIHLHCHRTLGPYVSNGTPSFIVTRVKTLVSNHAYLGNYFWVREIGQLQSSGIKPGSEPDRKLLLHSKAMKRRSTPGGSQYMAVAVGRKHL